MGKTGPELSYEDESHSYFLDGKHIPAVTDVCEWLSEGFDDIPPAILARARDIGHAVHHACALLCQKNLEWSTLDESIAGYVKAAQKFLTETGFKTLAVEHRMGDPDLRYAGTLDLYGIWESRSWIIDWKVTAIMPRTAGPQTAAYDHLHRRNFGGRPNKRAGVQLFADGTYKFFEFADPRDYSYFTSALNLYHWRHSA
jgi:hypothetical protein